MKTYTLTFTQDALNVLSTALGELPFKTAAPVVADLNAQLEKQAREERMAELKAAQPAAAIEPVPAPAAMPQTLVPLANGHADQPPASAQTG